MLRSPLKYNHLIIKLSENNFQLNIKNEPNYSNVTILENYSSPED